MSESERISPEKAMSDFRRQFDEFTKDVVREPFAPGGRIDSNGYLDMRWDPASSYSKWLNNGITLYLSYEGEEGPADRVVGMWIDLRCVLNKMEHPVDLEIAFGMKPPEPPEPIAEDDIDPRPFEEWFAELTAEMEEKHGGKPYEPGGWIDEHGYLNIYWENTMSYGEWLNHAITLYRGERGGEGGRSSPNDPIVGTHVDLRCVLHRQAGDLDILEALAPSDA